MDDAPPRPDAQSASDQPPTASELPPEAIALATRFFDGARNGQMDIFEQGLPQGLPANLTNDKGDTLVSPSPNNKRGGMNVGSQYLIPPSKAFFLLCSCTFLL